MNKSLKHFTIKGLTKLISNGDLTPEQEQVLFKALEVVKSTEHTKNN
ncbi:hypothetical protein ABHN03_16730 [Paenibacillus sp. NRS-1775]